MINRRGQIAQLEHRTIVDAEDRGRGGDGSREGLAATAVEEATAFNADGAPSAGSVLGRIHGQGTRSHLGQKRVGGIVEAHQTTTEGRIAVIVADVEGRRAAGTEDITRAGERAPGGRLSTEIVTGAGTDREIGEAGTCIKDAIAETACEDVEVTREKGLGVELQDPCPALVHRTRGADDRLELQGRAERIDIGDAVDVDSTDTHRATGGAEANAAFDVADRADVGRSGRDAARADRQDALGAGTVGVEGVEGANRRVTRGAHVVEDDAILSIITDVIERTLPRDGDVVRGSDKAGGEDIHRRSADHETLQGVRRRRDVRGALDMDRALIDEGAASVAVRTGDPKGVATRLDERDRLGAVGNHAADALIASALGVDEELGAARGERTLAVNGTHGLAISTEEEQATRGEREGLACRDIDVIAGREAHAEAVQRGIHVHGDVADGGGDVDVVRRGRQGDGVGRRGQVGVGRETVRTEGSDAEPRNRGGEVLAADNGPATEDATRETGVREQGVGQVDAVEITDDHAGRGADESGGAGEVHGTAPDRAVEAGEIKLGRATGDAGTRHVDERVRSN